MNKSTALASGEGEQSFTFSFIRLTWLTIWLETGVVRIDGCSRRRLSERNMGFTRDGIPTI